MEIKCIYPNKKLAPMSKKDIESIKKFRLIVMNYLKIKRLSLRNSHTGAQAGN